MTLSRTISSTLPPTVQGLVRRALARWRDRPRARSMQDARNGSDWESPPCAICGHKDVRPHFVFNGFRIVRCRHDGLIFVSPRPADVAPFYDERYYTGQLPGLYTDYRAHAMTMQGEWTARIQHLEAQLAGKGALLDVGAATGDFMALARNLGWTVAGVEPSRWAAGVARNEKGLEVHFGSLTSAHFASRTFDAVTLWDCIEHLSDPAATLREAARVMKPGGVIGISTGAVPDRDPALSSGWYYPPWHLYYFSPETLKALCTNAGFDVTDVRIEAANTPYALMTVTGRAMGR